MTRRASDPPPGKAPAAARGLLRRGLLVGVLAAGACTQPPTGDEIVAEMLDALGPENARAAVRSLRTIAEGAGPDGLFVTSMTSIRPDAVYFHQENALGTTEIWSTPERTWGGLQDEAYAEFGPAVRDFVRQHEFHLLLLDIRDRFSGFRYEGPEAVDGVACQRVAMTGESGNDASVCVREDDVRLERPYPRASDDAYFSFLLLHSRSWGITAPAARSAT